MSTRFQSDDMVRLSGLGMFGDWQGRESLRSAGNKLINHARSLSTLRVEYKLCNGETVSATNGWTTAGAARTWGEFLAWLADADSDVTFQVGDGKVRLGDVVHVRVAVS